MLIATFDFGALLGQHHLRQLCGRRARLFPAAFGLHFQQQSLDAERPHLRIEKLASGRIEP